MVLVVSCKKDEEETPPPDDTGGYEYVREDSTVVRIPGSAVTFAQQNFSRDAQMLREFQVATNVGGQWTQDAWQLGFGIWKAETWQVRQQYLVDPYDGRDVMTSDLAQFYFQIGEFGEQFGYGWMDTFDAANFNPDSAYTSHLWSLSGDAIQTVGFDGQSLLMEEYVGMWTTGGGL